MRRRRLIRKREGVEVKDRNGLVSWSGFLAALLVGEAALLSMAGCDDPTWVEWYNVPDTTLLYSLARPEMDLLSAMDLVYGYRVSVEAAGASGSWDLVLDTRDEQLVLEGSGFFGMSGGAAVATIAGATLESVQEAPRDTILYSADVPVPVEMGSVYVIRTRKVTDYYGYTCVYFAKLEPLGVDLEAQSLSFRYLVNPNCNSRDLSPAEVS